MFTISIIVAGTSTGAFAQSESAEIELLRPVLSPRAPVGVDSLALERPGTIRVGVFAHYILDPLVLEQQTAEELRVVANRATAQVAFAADVSKRVGLRASLPLAVSWGSTAPEYEADGFGTGDLSAGLRGVAYDSDVFTFGLHGDVFLPTSRVDGWLGERAVRIGAGFTGTLKPSDSLSISASIGGRTRDNLLTGAQLELGPELIANAGGYLAVSDAVALNAGLLGRFGLRNGTNALEAMVGTSLTPSEPIAVNLALGRGLTNGIGSSDFRVLAGLTFRREGPEPELELPSVIDDFSTLPDDLEDEILTVNEEEWEAGKRVRVNRGRVELRDPINFKVGTDRVLPESQPILDEVTRVLENTPEIIHVVIVGHASNEGSHEVNYALSLERGVAVYEELLRRGVHPDRLSVRAMGEVTPVGETADDAAARRVEFRITRALNQGEELPNYSTIDTLPFNGEQRPGGNQ